MALGRRGIALCLPWATACAVNSSPASGADPSPVAEVSPSGVAAGPEMPMGSPRRSKTIRMAITVDDLPAHGPVPRGVTRLQVHERLLEAFAKHGVPEAYGFVNGVHVERDPTLAEPLKAWRTAGHPLGNHTFSHPHLKEVGVDAYNRDVVANEAVLTSLGAEESEWKWFRYPFLELGHDLSSAREVRGHLEARGYRVAEVTVDFYDWAFNGPYVRCLQQGDAQAIDAMRRTYLSHARQMLRWADAAAQDLFGRAIPHVLLLHGGAFDAEMMDALLTTYEAEGVEWIPLAEALDDPAYEGFEPMPRGTGGTWLEQLIEARDAPHPPWPVHPNVLLDALCPESPKPPGN